MKKALSVITIAALLVSAFVFSNMTSVSAEPFPHENLIHLENNSGGAELLDLKVVNGQITAKVKLGENDYFQFLQPVSDLINGDTDGLQINIGDHDFGGTGTAADYQNCNFNIDLTDGPGMEQSVKASWTLVGGVNYPGSAAPTSYLHTYAANTWYSNYNLFSDNAPALAAQGVTMNPKFKLATSGNGEVWMDPNGATTYFATDKETAMMTNFIPGSEPVYVGITSQTTQTFNIRLNSADISTLEKKAGYWTLANNSGGATVISDELADGSITVKVTLKAGDYIQFLQPVSDLIDGATDGLQINLGDHDFGGTGDVNDYQWCGFNVHLTENADPSVTATNASWPLKGGNAQDPYVFYKYIHTGANAITTDYCLFTTDNTVMPNRGVAFPFDFSTDGNGKTLMGSKVSGENYYQSSDTTTDYAPETGTPVYVRIVSNITHTYNIRLNSADIMSDAKLLDGIVKILLKNPDKPVDETLYNINRDLGVDIIDLLEVQQRIHS